MNNKNFKCPDCGADVLDWRHFSEKSPLDEQKPFECTGFKCGKRWEWMEIWQKEQEDEKPKTEK